MHPSQAVRCPEAESRWSGLSEPALPSGAFRFDRAAHSKGELDEGPGFSGPCRPSAR